MERTVVLHVLDFGGVEYDTGALLDLDAVSVAVALVGDTAEVAPSAVTFDSGALLPVIELDTADLSLPAFAFVLAFTLGPLLSAAV